MAKKIKGYVRGLPPSSIKKAERLFRRKVEKGRIVGFDFAREICDTAGVLRRIVGVLISREGRVEEVLLGTREILYLPDLGRYRLGEGRLRRLRLIFSDLSADERTVHIPNDIYTDLEKLRLDLVAGVKTVRNQTMLAYAYNLPYVSGSSAAVRTERISDLARWEFDFEEFIEDLESQHASSPSNRSSTGKMRAVLVGVYSRGGVDPKLSMSELCELARTAELEVVETLIQRRTPDPKTLLGRGKLEEVLLTCLRLGAELVVFDNELRPSQWRVITTSSDLKIIDRSMLILDIFAQRASSSDGRLQVELAQLKYNLPRLVEKDAGLSRLTGEIGGRGPGETKLEIGRRRIRDRIRRLEKQIEKLGRQRQLMRKRREGQQIPLVAILGYTNVGKSTLFNALTHSSVCVEDKLFATLDPAQRRLFVPSANGDKDESAGRGATVVLSDTVGFIRDLPEELVNAFRATLEGLYQASLLVHVVDAADPELMQHRAAVESILEGMHLAEIPFILVLNKCDLLNAAEVEALQNETGGIAVSALQKEGLAEVVAAIRLKLNGENGAVLESLS